MTERTDKPDRLETGWLTVLWIFVPLYLIANAYLLYVGRAYTVLFLLAVAVYIIILAWLTARVTRPFVPDQAAGSMSRTRLWAQMGVLAAIILVTGLNYSGIPFWSEMVAWFSGLGESLLPVAWFGGPGNAVANPVQYFVIPFLLLLALGARPAELGLGRGHKVWQACLVWLALPAVVLLGLLLTGSLSPQVLVRRIIGNTFQNGFFEEFLFRGALQTRLARLVPFPWALAIQAFVFGLWHLRANTQSMDGNIFAGLALCIVSQTMIGLVYGYVFYRTRNLIAPSVAHVAMNVLGQSFG